MMSLGKQRLDQGFLLLLLPSGVLLLVLLLQWPNSHMFLPFHAITRIPRRRAVGGDRSGGQREMRELAAQLQSLIGTGLRATLACVPKTTPLFPLSWADHCSRSSCKRLQNGSGGVGKSQQLFAITRGPLADGNLDTWIRLGFPQKCRIENAERGKFG